VAEAAAEIGRGADLPEQPRQAFGAARPGREEGTELLGKVEEDGGVARSSRAGIFEFGLTATKPEPNWSPALMSIIQASYSAPAWPSASSSSSITVTLTPFGVPSE
jgi:hypothetical protein